MKSNLKKYKYFIVVLLFLLVVYVIVPSVNYTNCLSDNTFQERTIGGVVVRKYFDKSQHSTPIVEIQNVSGEIDNIYLFGDRSGLFERIQPKDTLKKLSGTNEVLIRSKGDYVQLGVADFGCDAAKFEDEKCLDWIYDIVGTVPSYNTLQDRQ